MTDILNNLLNNLFDKKDDITTLECIKDIKNLDRKFFIAFFLENRLNYSKDKIEKLLTNLVRSGYIHITEAGKVSITDLGVERVQSYYQFKSKKFLTRLNIVIKQNFGWLTLISILNAAIINAPHYIRLLLNHIH